MRTSPAASHYHLANEVKDKDKDKDTPDLACLKQLIALPWSMIADLETGILEFCSEFRLISERKGKDNKYVKHRDLLIHLAICFLLSILLLDLCCMLLILQFDFCHMLVTLPLDLHCWSVILTLDVGCMLVVNDQQHTTNIKSQNDASCCFLSSSCCQHDAG